MTFENLGREQIGRITGGRSSLASLARTCLLWIHRSCKTLSLGPPPRPQGDYVITVGISQENGSTILVPLKSDDEVVGRIAVDAVLEHRTTCSMAMGPRSMFPGHQAPSRLRPSSRNDLRVKACLASLLRLIDEQVYLIDQPNLLCADTICGLTTASSSMPLSPSVGSLGAQMRIRPKRKLSFTAAQLASQTIQQEVQCRRLVLSFSASDGPALPARPEHQGALIVALASLSQPCRYHPMNTQTDAPGLSNSQVQAT